MDYKIYGKDYLSMAEIVCRIGTALAEKLPLSLVRIGDGENIVLAQEKVLSQDWISKNVGWSHYSGYCGIKLPNIKARDRMIKAIRRADIVGVFEGDELTEQIFSVYDIRPKAICYAFENVYMPMYKPFVDLIRKYPPLLVGRPAEKFAELLQMELGITIPGIVKIEGYKDIEKCIREMNSIPHDWSLVSAGCNAVIIAAHMAAKHGKVCIDFGHAPDNAMSPDYPDYWLTTD